MQKKIIGGIVPLMLIGLFIGNWVYGAMLSKKIETQLIKRLELVNDRVEVRYGNIGVNPLFSKIKVDGFVITSKTESQIIKGKHLELNMSYSEALGLITSKTLEEVKSFRVNLRELEVYAEETNDKLMVNEIMLDFDGYLTKLDLSNIHNAFPVKKQVVRLVAADISLAQSPWAKTLGLTDQQVTDFNKIDKVTVDVLFNPNKKVLDVRNFSFLSPIVTLQSKASLSYTGDGVKGMRPKQTLSEIDLKLNKNGAEWGDAESTGRFSLQNLLVQLEAIVKYEEGVPHLSAQKSSVLLEDFKVIYAGQKKAQLEARTALIGLKMDEIDIKRFALESALEDDNLVVKNAQLRSSLVNADLDAIIKLDVADYKASEIVKGKLVISQLLENLKNGLVTFEMMTGQTIPRDGDDIILEMSGRVGRPTIKGLKY